MWNTQGQWKNETLDVTANHSRLMGTEINMADGAWKKFKENMKKKRTEKREEKGKKSIPKTGELTIQGLSSSVSGKAQKYLPIGQENLCHSPMNN